MLNKGVNFVSSDHPSLTVRTNMLFVSHSNIFFQCSSQHTKGLLDSWGLLAKHHFPWCSGDVSRLGYLLSRVVGCSHSTRPPFYWAVCLFACVPTAGRAQCNRDFGARRASRSQRTLTLSSWLAALRVCPPPPLLSSAGSAVRRTCNPTSPLRKTLRLGRHATRPSVHASASSCRHTSPTHPTVHDPVFEAFRYLIHNKKKCRAKHE